MLTLSSIAGVGGEERPGNSVTTYNDDVTIGSLKKQLRKAINDLADELDEEIKEVDYTTQEQVQLSCNYDMFEGNTSGECVCIRVEQSYYRQC